jgi:hypothetical protein
LRFKVLFVLQLLRDCSLRRYSFVEIIPAIMAAAFQGASLHAEVAELADAHV